MASFGPRKEIIMEYTKPTTFWASSGSKKRTKASAVLEATKAEGEKIEVVKKEQLKTRDKKHLGSK